MAEGELCVLVDYGGPEPKEITSLYCSAHAWQNGFCPGCGNFWAGCEVFDFSALHLCPNCLDALEENFDEPDDGYDPESYAHSKDELP